MTHHDAREIDSGPRLLLDAILDAYADHVADADDDNAAERLYKAIELADMARNEGWL